MLERAGRPALAWRDEGRGEPVVLVHGVGGDMGNWDGIVPALAWRFRIVRLDLSGHGRSGPIRSPVRVEDLARDLADVLDAAGIGACRLAGFSLGGAVALSLALDSPQRVARLALISTVAGRSDPERTGAESRIEVIRREGLAAIAAVNRDRWFTPEFQERNPELVEARVRTLLESDAESYLHAYTVFARTELAPRLAEIRVPTLVITGEKDVAATPRMARLMQERIAGAELHVLAGLRHLALDVHWGMELKQARQSSLAVMLASGLVTLLAAWRLFA